MMHRSMLYSTRSDILLDSGKGPANRSVDVDVFCSSYISKDRPNVSVSLQLFEFDHSAI